MFSFMVCQFDTGRPRLKGHSGGDDGLGDEGEGQEAWGGGRCTSPQHEATQLVGQPGYADDRKQCAVRLLKQ